MAEFFSPRREIHLLEVKKIWDTADHNAFTDLCYFQKMWWCAFRESDSHQDGGDGKIRLLVSADGKKWDSSRLFTMKGVDLRDPKLSIRPDGKLVLLIEGVTHTLHGKYRSRQGYIAFSATGKRWSRFTPILPPHEWLWRLTWHEGRGYGISYRYSDARHRKKEWRLTLVVTDDGIDYRTICRLPVDGYPNESTIRFRADGAMVALVRRDRLPDWNAWIGVSSPPYKEWEWQECRQYLGGPNFLYLPEGERYCGARLLYFTPYGWMAKTALLRLTEQGAFPELLLPSGGNTSYPGMVFHDGVLWMSYYSSHEGKGAIYLAKMEYQ